MRRYEAVDSLPDFYRSGAAVQGHTFERLIRNVLTAFSNNNYRYIGRLRVEKTAYTKVSNQKLSSVGTALCWDEFGESRASKTSIEFFWLHFYLRRLGNPRIFLLVRQSMQRWPYGLYDFCYDGTVSNLIETTTGHYFPTILVHEVFTWYCKYQLLNFSRDNGKLF